MSNYEIWTVEMLGARIIEWRERLRHAKTKGELLSIWGEIEKMEPEFDRAVFEGRTEASRRKVPPANPYESEYRFGEQKHRLRNVMRRVARWSLSRLDDETARAEGRASPSPPGVLYLCPECGLPLPGPHRGTCSASLAMGGLGYGLPKGGGIDEQV